MFFWGILVFNALAQAPEGIVYQAEARDNSGELYQNTSLDVKISILKDYAQGEVVWIGNHQVTTNNYGMFVLVIGTGTNDAGYVFDDIAWGKFPHFLNVQVKKSESETWIDMGTEQFLSVPYALHSKTASEIIYDQESSLKSAEPGVSSQNWSLFGNLKSDPDKDKLGTTDDADLVFVTNNTERLRITADGQLITPAGSGLKLGGNLAVAGDSTKIDKDLYVGRNVYLNTSDEFDPKGETINYGNFIVENASQTKLTGELEVDGNSILNDSLNVVGASQFDAKVNIDGDFSVSGSNFTTEAQTGNTQIAGKLKVEGDSVIIEKDLFVNGEAKMKHLEIRDSVPDEEYLATFENTHIGNGDGIKIKLGKKSANNGLQIINDWIEDDMANAVRDLIGCELSGSEKAENLGEILANSAIDDALVIGGLAVGVGNYIIGFINDELGLPRKIIPEVKVFPGFDWSVSILDYDIGFGIPSYYIGPYSLPSIPEIDLSSIGIEEIDITDLSFWGIPEICLSDEVNNPLNNENEFITFADVEDRHMGAVRAESVSDWAKNFIDPVYIYRLYSAFTSCVTDKKHALYHFKSLIYGIMFKYPSLGVEYSSGNGDYAEWLERIDPMENISAGDIVAVKAGKITKCLDGAEQIMAVSHKPIVLGNTPPEGKSYLGNNIAFMGQIPVKIMGPAQNGDYIVAKGEFPGYGTAVNPHDMTVEDFKLAVGRSWDTNTAAGPKMVNTVVGVHNGDYLNIFRQYEQRFKKSEDRLEALESKIGILTGEVVTGN